MGAWRCIECAINYPQEVIFERKCFACQGDLTWRGKSRPHENWKELVGHAEHVPTDIWMRAERLMNCGLDIMQALHWADLRAPEGGFAIDTHAFEKQYKQMREHGCEHEIAIRILAPDEISLTSKAL